MSSPTLGVQSIRRAFAVLRALGSGPLGVTDVAVASRIPKSTAARLLAALASEGAVEQVPGETRYRLGPDLLDQAALGVLGDLKHEVGLLREVWGVRPLADGADDWRLHADGHGMLLLSAQDAPLDVKL